MPKRLFKILGYRLVVALIAFFLWSCAAPQPQTDEITSAPKVVVPETTFRQPLTPIGPTEEVLKKLEAERLISKKEKQTLAEEYYQTGLKFYKELRLPEAKDNLAKALAINHDHKRAQELLDEVSLALGEYVHGEMGMVSRKLINEMMVKVQQAQIETQNHLNRGILAYQEEDYTTAEEEFKWVIESVQWFPYQTELGMYQKQAEDYLEKNVAKKREKEIATRRQQEEEARCLAEREEKKRQEDFRQTIEMLLNQAQTEFQKAQYKKAELLCRKILQKDPNNIMAGKLRVIALAAARAKLRKQTTQSMTEEWKRSFEIINSKTVPQARPLVLPDKETWEKIERRGPRSIFHEEEDSDFDRQAYLILERRLTFPYKEPVSLSEIIQFIRDTVPEINILIDTDQVDSQEQIAYAAVEVALKDALMDMLNSKEWSYLVKGGVIIITTRARVIEEQIETRWYDILDLTIPVIDFPGPQIGLAADVLPEEESPAMPRIHGDELVELIRSTIANKSNQGWDAPFDIAFQESTGILVARHLPRIHEDVDRLLKSIRASMDMIVTIETRFLTVQHHFLEDVGIDLKGLGTGALPGWVTNNPPAGYGFSASTSGVYRSSSSGGHVLKARVEHVLGQDTILNRFGATAFAATGSTAISYRILSNYSLNMIMHAIKKSEKSKVLVAPMLTIFNGQRAHIYISQQFTYIRDYDIVQSSGPSGISAADPVTDIVMDGIVLDVRPTISADLRYITLELRPTLALLDPPPPYLRILELRLNTQVPPWVQLEIPDMTLQKARINAILPDGATILIGGYSVGQEVDYISEVPILSKIPLLGTFFRHKGNMERKMILMILVRAKITILSEEEKLNY